MQKLWQFRFYCLDLVRRWPGVSGHTGVSGPKDPESTVHCFSLPSDLPVVRYWIGVRRLRSHRSLWPKGPGISGPVFFAILCQSVVRPCCLPGGTPEMARSLRSHRSLRPKGPGISGLKIFLSPLHLCGVVLDRGPEHPRRVFGVSGPVGVSGPLDRNLRSSPMT